MGAVNRCLFWVGAVLMLLALCQLARVVWLVVRAGRVRERECWLAAALLLFSLCCRVFASLPVPD